MPFRPGLAPTEERPGAVASGLISGRVPPDARSHPRCDKREELIVEDEAGSLDDVLRCLSKGLVFNLKHILCDFDCLINQCMHVVAAIYIKNG